MWSSSALCHRGKKGRHDPSCRRAGAIPRNFWAAWPPKSGVAPARFGLFSTVTFFSSHFVFLRLPRTSEFLRVKKLAISKVQSVILTFFTQLLPHSPHQRACAL